MRLRDCNSLGLGLRPLFTNRISVIDHNRKAEIALQPVAFAITFTTASLLRAASLRLLPRTFLPFVPPKPTPVPTCWAPMLPSPPFSRSTSSFITPLPNHDSTREQPADTSPRAFARRDQDRLGMGCAGDSLAQTVLASCASTSESGGILGMRL